MKHRFQKQRSLTWPNVLAAASPVFGSQEVCDTKISAPSDLSPAAETLTSLEGLRGQADLRMGDGIRLGGS